MLATFPWMRQLIAVVGVAGLLLISKTAAASCAPPEPPQQNLQRSDAVFSGEVVSIGDNFIYSLFGSDYSVTFNVIEAWKGATTTTITVNNRNDSVFLSGSSLKFPFKQGERYLVYAYHDSEIGNLTTNGCKGTKLLNDATADLRELGPPIIMLPPAPAQRSAPWAVSAALSLLVFSLIVLFTRYQRRSGQT